MKALAVFSLVACGLALAACDREMKEHKVPQAQLQKLKRQYSPEVQAQEVSGTISLPPGVSPLVPETAVLFVFLRPEGVDAGPPLAAKKISYFELPYEYSISPADAMAGKVTFPEKMTLTVRLDRDGDTKARAGDRLGSVTVSPGMKGADVVLSEVVAATGKTLSGTISLDPALQAKVPSGAVLFLFARRAGVAGGPPLAVKRLQGVTLPYTFSLSESDVMMPGAVFDGPVQLSARLDADGNALGAPGDIEGTVTATVGDGHVNLVLNSIVGG